MGKKLFMLIQKGVAQLTLFLGTWLLKFYHNLKVILHSQFPSICTLLGLVLPFRSYISNRSLYSELRKSNRQKLRAKMWIKVSQQPKKRTPKKRTHLIPQKKRERKKKYWWQFSSEPASDWMRGLGQIKTLCLPIPKLRAIVLSLDKNTYNLIHSPASFGCPGLIQT